MQVKSVECSLRMHKALGSIQASQKQAMVVQAGNPSWGEGRSMRSSRQSLDAQKVCGQPEIHDTLSHRREGEKDGWVEGGRDAETETHTEKDRHTQRDIDEEGRRGKEREEERGKKRERNMFLLKWS